MRLVAVLREDQEQRGSKTAKYPFGKYLHSNRSTIFYSYLFL